MRLVSLLPSATEIVYALGLGDDLVGVTFECDEPASARSEKTIVVGGRDTRGMSPAEIDTYVRGAAGRRAGPLHAARRRAGRAGPGADPDPGPVPGLRAAVRSGRRGAGLPGLPGRRAVAGPATHSTRCSTRSCRWGSEPGHRGGPRTWSAELRARLAAVAEPVAGRPRPRVAVVEWVDPPFTAGHWVPDLVTAAGGSRLRDRPGQRSVETSWESISRGGLRRWCWSRRAGSTWPARSSRPERWSAHFPDAEVWAIDADGLVVRPGPRLVDGVAAIASILHPGAVASVPASTARVA